MKYDVIVIGAGLAGLISSLNLAKNGKKVALFEKHYIPGGYATNFSRKGKDGNTYTFDVSLHSLSGANKGSNVYSIFENLNLLDDVTIIKKHEPSILMRYDRTVVIPNNADEYKERLKNNYPNHKDGVESLFKFLVDLHDNILDSILGKDVPKYDSICEKTLEEFLKTYVDDDNFIEDFSYLWTYAGLPASKLNAYYAMVMITSYIIGGENYIKGGSGNLSKIIKEHIEKNGSDVFLSSEIVSISANENKLLSVTTKKDETFEADEFICACDPNHIFSLINNATAKKYLDELNTREKGNSIVQLYIGIDCSSKEVGIDTSHLFYYGNNSDDEIYKSFIDGTIDPKNLGFVLTTYDKLDPDLNKHGAYINMAILDYSYNWPERGTDEYKAKKEKVKNMFLDKLTSMFPKIKDHIQVLELGTPRTTQRYTNNSNGCIYGWAQTIEQGGTNRAYTKTSFENLMLAGAWSYPGGGYEGAIVSGYLTSNRLLAKNCSQGESNGLISIEALMKGLIKKFNPENAEGLDITYKFMFDDHEPIYLHVKDKKAELLDIAPDRIDTTLKMSHQTWHKIAFNEISGQDAIMDGLVEYEGSLRNFASMPKIFNK